jgi:hypothetical protein
MPTLAIFQLYRGVGNKKKVIIENIITTTRFYK